MSSSKATCPFGLINTRGVNFSIIMIRAKRLLFSMIRPSQILEVKASTAEEMPCT